MNVNSYNCCSPNKKEFLDITNLLSLLQLIAEKNRLQILCILNSGEHCVCEIIKHVGASQSLISHHLHSLKQAKLVGNEKRGPNVYYFLTEKGKEFMKIFNLLKEVKI